MKRFMTLLKLLVFVFCFSLLYGCGIKRIVTKTITIIDVDTIIQVRVDTVLIHDTLSLQKFLSGDTLTVENKVARARTYFDRQTQTIKIDLKGLPHNVPVTIHAQQVVKNKEVTMPVMRWYIWFIFGFATCGFIVMLIKLRK